jgi:hypothetical protein
MLYPDSESVQRFFKEFRILSSGVRFLCAALRMVLQGQVATCLKREPVY